MACPLADPDIISGEAVSGGGSRTENIYLNIGDGALNFTDVEFPTAGCGGGCMLGDYDMDGDLGAAPRIDAAKAAPPVAAAALCLPRVLTGLGRARARGCQTWCGPIT